MAEIIGGDGLGNNSNGCPKCSGNKIEGVKKYRKKDTDQKYTYNTYKKHLGK